MNSAISILKQSRSFQQRLEKKIKKKSLHLNSNLTTDVSIPNDFQQFCEMLGYPQNRNTGESQKMTDYQLEYDYAINNYHKVIVNKSRKLGATESAIRSIAKNVFGRYAGHDVMIVAGNQLNIAREILKRFDELFFEDPKTGHVFKTPDADGNLWSRNELIRKTSINSQFPVIEFRNDTRVFCFAASKSGKSQTFRGPDDTICIFLSEAAHVGMVEDGPLMTALAPNLANRDNADFIMESTPNGRRGFYYNYWMDTQAKIQAGEESSWYPLEWDYTFGLAAKVLSKKFIEQQKNDVEVDFAQEYCCKFTSTKTAAFDESDITYLNKDDPEPVDLLHEIGVVL